MGMESYLFDVIFEDKIRNEEVISLFKKVDVTFLEDYDSYWSETSDYKSLFFEIRSEKGLTEIHILLNRKEGFVKNFSVRFSVVSPATVIDQTFDFFEQLNSQTPIILRDTEIKNHLWRQDVKAGKRSNSFESMRIEHEDDKHHEKLSFIPLNADEFKANQMDIAKRKIVLENETGAIIGGGGETFRYLENTQTNIGQKMVKIIEDEL